MQARYSMKAVSRLTGLSADRLRIWEKRHGVVQPRRSPTGRRSYSEPEVARLKLLSELLPLGHAIGTLSALSDKELMALRMKGAPTAEAAAEELAPLLQALGEFRFEELRASFARLRHLVSPRELAFRLVPQIMAEVGRMIDEGKFQIAQEHAVSDLLRHDLRQIYEDLAPLEGKERGSFVFASPEGHLHDFGVLLAAIRCRFHGIRTHFLGANMPAGSLVQAAKELGAGAVVLGISSLPPGEEKLEVNDYLRTLDRDLPRRVSLWLGGPGVARVQRRKLSRDTWIFATLDELDGKLGGKGR